MMAGIRQWVRGFLSPPRHERLNLGRRAILLAVAAGAGGTSVARIGAVEGHQSFSTSLIRPPGSTAEDEFLARCVRCGECMRVCDGTFALIRS